MPRESGPELKVLFITGYAENAVLGRSPLGGEVHVMSKPLSMGGLTRRIAELVNRLS